VISARRCLVALVACGCVPLAFAATASAQEVLYGADGAGGNPSSLYILDPGSGAVVENIGPIGFAVTGLAVDPSDGTLYGSTSRQTSGGAPNPGSLIRIDRTTGAGTLVGDLRPDTETAADITFAADGTLFGWLQPDSRDLVTIDKATGAASIVGDSGLNTEGGGLASSPGGVLFLAESDNGPLRTVDRSTGATTTVATMNGTLGFRVPALAFNAGGALFGAVQEGSSFFSGHLITIDTATGAVTLLGPSVARLDAITFAEPQAAQLQTARSVSFDATKAKAKAGGEVPRLAVKKGRKARLSGDVNAPQDVAGCESSQTVQLQRKKPKQTTFTTFQQVQTDAAGSFSTEKKIKKTLEYRAILGETAACDDATSNSEKVKAKKKKKKKG